MYSFQQPTTVKKIKSSEIQLEQSTTFLEVHAGTQTPELI